MSGRSRSLAPSVGLLKEQRYRRHFLREDGKQAAIVLMVVSVAYAAAARNDFLLLQGGWLLAVCLAARGLLVVVAIALPLQLRRARWPRQQDLAVRVALLVTTISVVVTSLTRIPGGQIVGVLIAHAALICVLYFAQRGPVWPRAITGSAIVIASLPIVVLTAAKTTLEPAARPTSLIALVGLNVVGVFSARSFEEQRRKRFEAERSERHARQELAVKLRELAVEKERAEAMSRARAAFLAAMSHELRTPMNAVIGLSDLLLDEPLAPEHGAHVRTISDSARALLGLLNDVLDFVKIDAQKVTLSPAPFNLRGLAGSVIDMLRPAAKARALELTLELSLDGPEHLLGDDARLRQVLVNLVSNAIKFTERGAVTLGITVYALEGSEHEVVCRVEDTGIGMTPEGLARLFRPFEQADGGIARRYGGTGLGLAISKQIVLAMGGDIHVESLPGRGSVFSFAIRLAAAAPPAEAAVVARSADRPPLAILVVDDHPINREVARGRLGRLGYRIDLANDGPEAIEAVSNKDYDVVFMDLQMPGMSGIEATVRIGERLAGKPAPHIIAMTASVFEEDREACRKAGMRDFVGKPIDLEQLDAVLERVAEERGAAKREATATTLATLAREPIARLRELEALGEPDFFANLCRLFLADLSKRLPGMAAALERGDARTIEHEAHALKSTCGALGATEMSDLFARAEGAAHAGRIAELQPILEALVLEHRVVERALLRELETPVA